MGLSSMVRAALVASLAVTLPAAALAADRQAPLSPQASSARVVAQMDDRDRHDEERRPMELEGAVDNVSWNVCSYPDGGGCGVWRFRRNGIVQGLVDGRVVWEGRWVRLRPNVYRYRFEYEGRMNSEWVRFSDPRHIGRATELFGYPSADMSSPHRRGRPER